MKGRTPWSGSRSSARPNAPSARRPSTRSRTSFPANWGTGRGRLPRHGDARRARRRRVLRRERQDPADRGGEGRPRSGALGRRRARLPGHPPAHPRRERCRRRLEGSSKARCSTGKAKWPPWSSSPAATSAAAIATPGTSSSRCPRTSRSPSRPVLGAFRRQRGWLDGVVISGGEPTLHPDLLDFIRAVPRRGHRRQAGHQRQPARRARTAALARRARLRGDGREGAARREVLRGRARPGGPGRHPAQHRAPDRRRDALRIPDHRLSGTRSEPTRWADTRN